MSGGETEHDVDETVANPARARVRDKSEHADSDEQRHDPHCSGVDGGDHHEGDQVVGDRHRQDERAKTGGEAPADEREHGDRKRSIG